MEESQSSIETTGSRCAPQTAQGRHVFEIAGYSLQKGLGVGKFVQSATYAIGSHDWRIRFYPNGDAEEGKDYVAVFLELISNTGEVRVLYDFSLVNLEIMLVPKVVLGVAKPMAFRAQNATMGFRKFMGQCSD
jgi:speckle-type POZ protein